MSNLMAMLYTGASGVSAAQAQISVTGHNMANIGNTDYTRQRANIVSASTAKEMDGAFGRGVKVAEIIRTYDTILARTVRNETSSLYYWAGTQTNLNEIKTYFNELPNENSGLGNALQKYFDSWQSLSNSPTDSSDASMIKRTTLLENAQQLCTQIQDDRAMLEQKKVEADERLNAAVGEINIMSTNIAALNKQIVAVEAGGQNANDLRDSRDALVKKIGVFCNVTVYEKPNGEYSVTVGGQPLVDSSTAHKLETRPNKENDGHLDIYWTADADYDSSSNITDRIFGGKIQADIKTRDVIINGYIDKLDKMATTLITETNKVHSAGQGLERFTQQSGSNPAPYPGYPLGGEPGQLPYPVVKGTFQIKVYDSAKQLVDTYNVSIDPAEHTLNGIAELISGADGNVGGGDIQSYVDSDGNIKISSKSGYTFAFGEDTSGFLVAAGFNNFFKGTDASTISVDEHVKGNPKYLAASLTGAPGDNQNALKLANVKQSRVASADGGTIDEFYSMFIGQIATDKQQVDIFVKTKTATVKDYSLKLQSITGVSMDEEQTNMIQFQRVFEANSRFINVVDEMLNTIINNFGLVGR